MKKLTGFSAVQLETQLKKAEAERDEARLELEKVREEKSVAVLGLIDAKRVEVERWIKAEIERDEARAAESILRVGLNTAIRDRDEARRIARQMRAERDALREQYAGLVPFMNDIERERADWMGKYYELLRKHEPDRSQPFEYTTPPD